MRGWLLPIALLCGICSAAACSSSSSTGTPVSDASPFGDDGGGDEIVALPSGHLGGEAGPPPDAGPSAPQVNLRVAHLSPDLPPLDVCVAPHGTTSWSGPLIGQLAGMEAGAPGVSYAQVSAYLAVASGQSDVVIVPAGSTACDVPAVDAGVVDGATDAAHAGDGDIADAADATSPLDGGSFPAVPVVTSLPALAANANATLLIAGGVSPSGGAEGLTFAVVLDDAQLAGGAASLRAINALSHAGALDFGLGSFTTKWTALLTNVAFGAASKQAGPDNGTVDLSGYLPIPSLSGETISARASSGATGDAAIAKAVTIPFGSVATVIAVGRGAGDSAHPPALLVCIDNQPSGGILSDCSLAQ